MFHNYKLCQFYLDQSASFSYINNKYFDAILIQLYFLNLKINFIIKYFNLAISNNS